MLPVRATRIVATVCNSSIDCSIVPHRPSVLTSGSALPNDSKTQSTRQLSGDVSLVLVHYA